MISSLTRVLLDRGPFTRAEALAIAIASTSFALVFCYLLVFHLSIAGTFGDWDFIGASQQAAYWTVHKYHQVPFWNAYECGGMPLLGDPQSHLLTPWFLLTLMFGPVVGLHLEVIVYCAIAWAGGYVLGRVLGMRRIAAIYTASAFAGSSWFFLRASEGHIVIMVLVYLPWILAAGWTASDRGKVRYAAICGALIAVSFFEGSPYIPLYEGLTLGLVLFGRAVAQWSVRPLIALAVAAIFTAGFGAVKGLPAMQVIASHPRPTDVGYSNSVYALGESLLSRNQDHSRPGLNGWGFWESGAYLGLFAGFAFAALRFPRRSMPWIFAAIVLFQLARGWTGPNSAWVWLHRIPLFTSTRLPSRLLIPFALMAAVLAGLGIDAVCSQGSPALVAVSAFIIIVGVVDFFLVGPPNLRYALTWEVPRGSPPPEFEQYQRPPALAQSSVVRDSQGVVNCYTYTDWPTQAKGWNEASYRGEQYLLGQGSVALVRWTPNRLEYAVDTRVPSVMVVNQNYDPSWRVASGPGQAFSQDGLLAVRVPAGKSRIVLKYISISAIYGMIISMLTVLAAFLLFRWESRRDLRDAS